MNLVFTICSGNYLSEAFSLKETLSNRNADPFYIILADKSPIDKVENGIIEVGELGIEEELLQNLVSKYNIIEFNTAMKPFAFRYLYEKFKADKIIYIDPDIMVLDSLDLIWNSLNEYDFTVTPHILSHKIDPEKYHLLIASINTGIFNLGFLGLRVNETTQDFLAWWRDHLQQYGGNNIRFGQFYDQKVLNLLPVFYERVCILKHPGLNVAQWNFHERHLTKKDGQYFSNDKPLIFFHCSGVSISSFEDNLRNIQLLKSVMDCEVYRDLLEYYIGLNQKHRFQFFRSLRCAYDFHPDIHRSSKYTVYKYKIKKWLRKTLNL